MFGNLPEQLGAIRSGRTRALAVTTLKRNAQLPDVPTVDESGYAGFQVTVWYGVCTQAAVPRAMIAKLNEALVRTVNMPEVRERLAQSSIEASPMGPAEFAAFIKTEIEKWTRVVSEARLAKQ
jgi:tripartite-type tricarboxylate transporter receptor subunit TctC